MTMRLLQEGQVSLEPILAFPFLDLGLHPRNIGAELELFAIAEPDVVVGLALDEPDAFGFERCVKVFVTFDKQAGEE